MRRNSLYLRLRRQVDRDCRRYFAPSHILGFIPAALALAITENLTAVSPTTGRGFAIAITAPWIGFLIWRYYRVNRAAMLSGARHYDQVGKFQLPHEYARTESALAARLRARRSR